MILFAEAVCSSGGGGDGVVAGLYRFASGGCGGQRIRQRGFYPAQSSLTTSKSIITAATKTHSVILQPQHTMLCVPHSFSAVVLLLFFIRGLKREVNPQTNLHRLTTVIELGSVLTHCLDRSIGQSPARHFYNSPAGRRSDFISEQMHLRC